MLDQKVVPAVLGLLTIICMTKAQDDQGILLTVISNSNAKLRVIPGEPNSSYTGPVAGIGFNDQDTFLRSCDVDVAGKRIFVFDAHSNTIIAGTHFNNVFNNSNQEFNYIHYGISTDFTRIAYDWLSDNIYWTDPVYKTIGIQPARANDSHNSIYKIIVDDLNIPGGITVDSLKRYLFWTDTGTPKIVRSDLSGESPELLVTRSLLRPNAVVADVTQERIYWTDYGRDTIETVTYNGEDRKKIRHLAGTTLYDIAVYQEYLLTTEINYKSLWYVNKDPAGTADFIQLDPTETKYGVAVYHGDVQPDGPDNCNSSACSDICVNDNNTVTGYSCLCRQGYTLDSDNTTCIEDNSKLHRNILLSNRTTICSLDVRALSISIYDIECFYTNPNDTASEPAGDIEFLEFDALRRNIYFATSTSVYKLNLDQTQPEAVNMFTVTGTISGISYDWIDYILYVSDSATGSIYAISVDTLNAVIVQSSLNSPFSILVVPLERKLFWLSITTSYTIESADIDATSTSAIVGSDRLTEPKDLSHDANRERLFWVDSYRIRSCRYDGSDVRLFMRTNFLAYLLTIYKDYLVWLSQYNGISYKYAEHMIQPISINARQFDDLGYVTDLMVIDETLQPRQKGPCDSVNSPCDQLCLSTKGGAVCHCEFGYQTADNGQTCTSEPVEENFVLVSDWTHNRMYQIDLATGDEHAVATFQTEQPTSLVYNPKTSKIVWSSYHSEEIIEVNLDGSDESVLGRVGSAYVERITIDETSGNIFYAAIHEYSIYVAGYSYIGVMSPDGRHARVINYLHFPGGIAIHAGDGLLFYTERGDSFRYIGRANMDGSADSYLVRQDLIDPKGLAIDYEARRLYWTDTIQHRISSVKFDGSDRQIVIEDPGADMVDLHLDEHFIYYIGWNRPHVTRVSKTNNTDVVMLAQNAEFGRLEALFVFSEYYVAPPINTNCQNNSGKGDCSTFCLPSPTGSVCACEVGYTLQADSKTCDNGVDDCVGVKCQNGGTCEDGVDTFTCLCQAGYTGELCATDINECDNVTCLNGGTCQDEVSAFSCQCVAGFTGTLCDQNINECDSVTCLNGGNCTDAVYAFACQCVAGFTGTLCEQNIYDCIGVTCQNGGTCQDGIDSYTCKCVAGYTGLHCEQDINECYGVTCQNDGSCHDGIDSYTCQCVAGYTGLHCEHDINECDSVTCQNGGTCYDIANNFTCQCADGFTGTLCEQNINECTGVTCQNGGTCQDGINTYTCQCVLGYTGALCGENINDCIADICHNGGTCQDGVNSFTCLCSAGYTGPHCEQNVNDCDGITCQNGGTCHDGLTLFTCQCATGYAGSWCELNINDCTGVTCLNGGTCQDGINSYTCKCIAGYTGILCQENINECIGVTCYNGGTCQDDVNSYTCQCVAGYTGIHCEQNVNDCADVTCRNGGTCQDGISSYICQCVAGFTGLTCEQSINDCTDVTCDNGGTCQDGINSYTCQCVAGYTGLHCEQNIDECSGVVCQNEGTCQDGVNSFTCLCKVGYTGALCQQDIDNCAGINCQNGGTCQDRVNSYTCQCMSGFTGNLCEQLVTSTTVKSTTAALGEAAPSSDDSSSIGPIVGGSVASLAVLGLGVAALIVFWRRRRAKPRHERLNPNHGMKYSKKDAKVSRYPDPESHKPKSSKESVVDLRSYAGSVISSHKPKSSRSSVHSHRPVADNEIAYLGMTNPVYDIYGDELYAPSHQSSRPPSIAGSYAPSYAGSYDPYPAVSRPPSMAYSGNYDSIHSSQMTPYNSTDRRNRDSRRK